jgi:hypothetical protein
MSYRTWVALNQLNTNSTLYTYIYHHLPLTYFSVFYTIFKEIIYYLLKNYVLVMLLYRFNVHGIVHRNNILVHNSN